MNRPSLPRRIAVLAAAIAIGAGASALCSCSLVDTKPAMIWTDVPEIAYCAELFNDSQQRFLVEVQWKADLVTAIRQTETPPALAIGHYLKSRDIRGRFLSLNYLFGELAVNPSVFYNELLAFGKVGGRQILLPVSFNLPAIIFPRGTRGIKNDFLLGLDDMAGLSKAFNRTEGAAYVRMGFSPRWDGDFLTLAVDAAGADFREGLPLDWNQQGLRSAVAAIRAWTTSVNGPSSLEDDFQFKYLFTPAYQYVSAGRSLFAYVDSDSFFLIPEEKRRTLDYRWFAHSGSVPISVRIVLAGLLRSGGGRTAAEAFLKWFFTEKSQREILESERRARALESFFGIAGGFSSLRSVDEKVYPLFYPALVGHLPPAAAMSAPPELPSDWPQLKRSVVAPWLTAVTGRPGGSPPGDLGRELAAKIADYIKKSPSP
ncbi:MAG: carbohydrate ABC transporter substrate-binding protein [Treponema sp.]|nr:carbohydrate ABC transporter substrate-binding protein [Treponema sp.]